MMDWTHVSSTNVQSVAYDTNSASLYVKFHSGGTYVYYDVPVSVYNGLMSAASHGSYLARHVKGSYRYNRL